MGGKGSGRPSNEETLKRNSQIQKQNPIADGMFIPNLSGDLSRGKVIATPTADLNPVNKKYVDDVIISHSHILTDGATDVTASKDELNVLDGISANVTAANLNTLTGDSMADALHRHSELSASDGSPNPALSVDASGNVGIGTTSPTSLLHVEKNYTGGTSVLVKNTNNQPTDYSEFALANTYGKIAGIRLNPGGGGATGFGAHVDTVIYNTYNSSLYGDIVFSTHDGTSQGVRMTIDTLGNVGIGTTTPDEMFSVADYFLTTSTGDTYWAGAGTGLPYGSCSSEGVDINWTQAGATQNTWYDISDADINDGQLNLVTHDGSGKLTVSKAGRYLINYFLCAECSVANKHIRSAISVSGTENAQGQSHYENKAINQEFGLSSTAILSLAANDTINLSIGLTDAVGADLKVECYELTAVMVGG